MILRHKANKDWHSLLLKNNQNCHQGILHSTSIDQAVVFVECAMYLWIPSEHYSENDEKYNTIFDYGVIALKSTGSTSQLHSIVHQCQSKNLPKIDAKKKQCLL